MPQEEMPNSLTITLSDDDGRVSVAALIKKLEELLTFLRGIQSSFVGSDGEVQWNIVRVTMKSPLRMTFAPTVKVRGRARPVLARKMTNSAFRCAEGLERGTRLPVVLNDEALEAARKLVKTAGNEGMTVTVGTDIKSQQIQLTQKAVQHIDEIAARARLYVDYSTIEGVLDVVSVRDHKSFYLTETLTEYRIECLAGDAIFTEALARIGSRVAVTGRVRYRNHVPKSINVEGSIRVLRTASELPQPSDIGPIDITGGLPSEEFVRRIRNA